MSRVGKKPIQIPAQVKVSVQPGRVLIEGPKGKLETAVPRGIKTEMVGGNLVAQRESKDQQVAALHGLVRSLLANAVHGVTEGFQKALDIVGIGYKAEMRGPYLNLSVGHSHPVEFPVPEGISIRVERETKGIQNYVATVVVSGIDKQRVGQVAADIRALRPPDAYKGKGIRYADEVVRLKVGKKGA